MGPAGSHSRTSEGLASTPHGWEYENVIHISQERFYCVTVRELPDNLRSAQQNHVATFYQTWNNASPLDLAICPGVFRPCFIMCAYHYRKGNCILSWRYFPYFRLVYAIYVSCIGGNVNTFEARSRHIGMVPRWELWNCDGALLRIIHSPAEQGRD